MLSFSVLAATLGAAAQRVGYSYFFDDGGRLVKVIDSSGNEIDYTYDTVGNIIQVARTTAPPTSALAILDFTPQSGPVGTTVTIEGQNFGTTLASNAVSFNGVAATVLSASATTLTVSVPTTATTGPISVTVAGVKSTSTTNFTVIPTPTILSISPQYLVSSPSQLIVPSFQVTGQNLTGATFSFLPAFVPPLVTVGSATINPNGTSAVLSLTIAPGTVGSFTLVGTNTAGTPNPVPGAGNTLQIITPDGDADGDGLTNAVEMAIGTNPINAYTSGDGLPDGWQVFYGLNPLYPTVAGKDFDASGLTVLQDFQMGLSPINPNRVPPTVSQVSPANGAKGAYLNSIVNARFSEPLLIGTSLNAAQSAIAAALGSNTTVALSSQQIAAQTLQTYLNRTCCGNSVVQGTVSVTGPAGPVAGGVIPSSDGLSATFSPSLPLQSNTQYSVKVTGVRDAAGNLMTKAFTSTFTTGSSIQQAAPEVIETNPLDGASNVATNTSIVVTFSLALNPSSLTQSTFLVADTTAGMPVSGTFQLDASYTVVTFVPSQALTANHWFSVTLTNGITSLEVGNPLPGNAAFGFSTGGISEEVDGLTFSVLNGIGTTTRPSSANEEVDGLTFSVLNGIGTTTRPSSANEEVDGLTFSVLNGIGTTKKPSSVNDEVDGLTFSVLNGIGTTKKPNPVNDEVDGLIFSVLNLLGTSTQSKSVYDEADGLSFSLLNGTTPPAVGPVEHEADGLTFSVNNTAVNVAKNRPSRGTTESSNANTQSGKSGGRKSTVGSPGNL